MSASNVTPDSKIAQRPSRQPGYLARLLAALRGIMRPGSVRVAHIYHDDWCLHWISGGCDCHPDITVGPDLTRGDS
ncbi:MAG: hypothetical protein DMD60_05100, partial [Gemmatimonadetes bacterium]